MTQKEALKNVLSTIENPIAKKWAVLNWLQDINFHTEYGMIDEDLKETETDTINDVQELLYVLYPSDYSRPFVLGFYEDHDEWGKYSRRKKARENYQNHSLVFVNDRPYSTDAIFDFHLADTFYRTFNRIFGWGLNTDDWDFVRGEDFVVELYNLIEDSNEKQD